MTGLPAASGGLGSAPAMTWLEVSTEDLGRWTWGAKLSWPRPLSSSGVGRWEPSFEEFLGHEQVSVPGRSRGEERLLATLATVLAQPQYCAYVIRSVGDPETDPDRYAESHYAALVRDDDAIVIVDEPGTVRLGRAHPTAIAAAIAGQLPKLQAAPVTRVVLAKQTVELISSGLSRPDTPERTLRSAMSSAGISDATATRLFATVKGTLALGIVGAIAYASDGVRESARCASWTELSDGGMISAQVRSSEIVWEPLTAAAIGRTLADALAGLGS